MIIVSLKPGQLRQNQGNSGRTNSFISSIVNWHPTPNPNVWRPPTDVFESEDKITVRVEIAGMNGEDISVNFDQGYLTIHGIRTEVSERRAFHQMEIPFGEFMTEIAIPTPINMDKIEATYQDGFLKIMLLKAIPRQINITQE
jgi:HSP20 family protein